MAYLEQRRFIHRDLAARLLFCSIAHTPDYFIIILFLFFNWGDVIFMLPLFLFHPKMCSLFLGNWAHEQNESSVGQLYWVVSAFRLSQICHLYFSADTILVGKTQNSEGKVSHVSS